MWLKGDKTSPMFTYSPAGNRGANVLLDEVKYHEKGQSKTITGYDYDTPRKTPVL